MTTPSIKPMLAASCDDLTLLTYPLEATPKIDGIRCLIIDGKPYSRRMKLIPNKYIQRVLGRPELNGLDGELVIDGSFQDVTSGIMTREGTPDFKFKVFDRWDLDSWVYFERLIAINQMEVSHDLHQFIEVLEPTTIEDRIDLTEFLDRCLEEGHEGVMVRDRLGLYKHGRSTFKERGLIKIKTFEDDEAQVIGFEEQMHNGNEAKQDAFGRTERSSHKANLVGKNTLGALIVQCKNFTAPFRIGTGFDDALRLEIWNNKKKYSLQPVKFRYQKIGTKDKPRIPVFLGFRHKDDL